MSARTLYWVNGSIPSWQVMLALHEKRLAFESQRLRVMGTRETQAPEFLAINPRGQAPALVEADGTVVVESMAILHYLERVEPARPLLPQAPSDLALTLGRVYETERLRSAYRPLEKLFLGAQAMSEQAIEAARAAPERVARELELWEQRLGEGPFIAGATLSLADVVFYPALAYQLRRGLRLEGLPRLTDYVGRMGSRGAAKAARPVGWKGRGKRDLFSEASRI